MRLAGSFLALLPLALLGGCVPIQPIEFRIEGYNERLRGDRAALDAGQMAVDVRDLRFGPYPTAAAELVRPLTPADPRAGSLVQSDCWFMGQAPLGGGDAVRADWEAIAVITNDVPYVDPEDGRLDIGWCRLADPETRIPPLHKDRRSEVFPDIDCGRSLGTVVVRDDANLFRCREDTAIFGFRLAALRDTAPDPLGRCHAAGSSRFTQRVAIKRGVDFWSGLHLDGPDGPEVGSCGSGNTLVPGAPTVYEIDSVLGGPRVRFEPALFPIVRGTRVVRPLSPVPNGFAWSTPLETAPNGGPSRWQENWSPTLRVVAARLVGFDPPLGADEQRTDAVAEPIAIAGSPRLCIEDPSFGPGCRWTCAVGPTGAGGSGWPLTAPGACRNASGLPEIPLLTPTYAVDRLASGVAPAPLRWSVQTGTAPLAMPWIEFELDTVFEPAALRAEPPAADAGRLQVGRSARVGYRIDNVGGQAVEVTAVEVDPQTGHAGDFRVELPFAPVPMPVPVEVDRKADAPMVLQPPDPEALGALSVFHGLAHARVSPVSRGTALHDGVAVVRRHGQWQRDLVDVRFDPKPLTEGGVFPATLVTWALRRPPFVLQPGESFDVSLVARPAAVGVREARVRVRGHAVLDPSLRVDVVFAARAQGLAGPALRLLPAQLSMVAAGPGEERVRSVLLVNDGDVGATPGAPQLAPAGGAAPAQGTAFAIDLPEGGAGPLAPGASRLARIAWRARCLPGASGIVEEHAVLRWPTTDGTLTVPIRGSTWCGP